MSGQVNDRSLSRFHKCYKKNSAVLIISSFFDHQRPGPGLDPDSLEMLDPDLDGSICKVVVLDRGAGHLFDL